MSADAREPPYCLDCMSEAYYAALAYPDRSQYEHYEAMRRTCPHEDAPRDREDAMTTATDVRERWVLQPDDMVRAILADRKTQSRHPVWPQPPSDATEAFAWHAPELPAEAKADEGCYYRTENGLRFYRRCPYGKPGDLLYVREAFAASTLWNNTPPRDIPPEGTPLWYRADGAARGPVGALHPANRGRWRPSIHMPKWAARTWLELTDVRVERVQDISAADCYAEGITATSRTNESLDRVARDRYREMWDAAHAERGYPWEANPWVWALTFRRIER